MFVGRFPLLFRTKMVITQLTLTVVLALLGMFASRIGSTSIDVDIFCTHLLRNETNACELVANRKCIIHLNVSFALNSR